jgi:hypothetical protein
MHDALLVELAKRGGDADGHAQEVSQFPGTSDQRGQDLSARILEQQCVAAVVPHD